MKTPCIVSSDGGDESRLMMASTTRIPIAASTRPSTPRASALRRPVAQEGRCVDWGKAVCGGCLAGLLLFGCPTVDAQASLTNALSSQNAIFDAAKVIPTGKRQQTNDDLIQFEQDTGWRIRLLSGFQGELNLTESDVREAWKPNDKTVIVAFDPSSPNIVAFRYIGDDVQAKLKRAFWVELQSRFGNLFFVRQEGEAAAVDGIVDSLKVCLARPEGCGVVPGLSTDQFLATLWVSLAGGVVLGFSSKLDADALYQRLGWILVFSPLWLILFVNLGLGPILTRTDDRLPVIINTAAFLAVALVFQWLDFPPKWMKSDASLRNKDDPR